jgi:uncharacterized delta-60 repeat protein
MNGMATIVLQVWVGLEPTYEAAVAAGEWAAESTFTNPTGDASMPATLTGMPAVLLTFPQQAGPPQIAAQPSTRSARAGDTVWFPVTFDAFHLAQTYRWFKGGSPVSDNGTTSGSTTSKLIISNVLGGDAGNYSVVAANSYGAVTSSVARLTVDDPLILTQPANQYGNAGSNATFSVSAFGASPLSYQWYKAGAVLNGATDSSLILSNLQSSDAGNYNVVVRNAFGSVTSSLATLTLTLDLVDGFNPGASNSVYVAIPQPDGKILVGGAFTNLAGQARNYIGRLNADGTLDPGFNPGANGAVNCMALQSDGKILVGGSFTNLAGQSRQYIGRLNADGSPDGSFNPGADKAINAIVWQPDGKILVGGAFGRLAGVYVSAFGRLNPDGTVDANFSQLGIFNSSSVYSISLQPNGQILVGGSFSYSYSPSGQTRYSICRLNADGTLDTTFNGSAASGGYPGSSVYSLAVQGDGKIVVGGTFPSLSGQARTNIGRLNADGTLDTTFNPGTGNPGDRVSSLALQTDGKILVAGVFTNLGGQSRSYIGRLNTNGTVDSGFNPGANTNVYSLALQADGRILVAGDFTTLTGQPRARIGRLINSDAATQSLTFDWATATWLRSGTAPELSYATLEAWQGVGWTNVATLSRITGGWQATGLNLVSNSAVRIQGWSAGGSYNGSAGMEQSYFGGLGDPVSRTNSAGTTATFSVFSVGAVPAYQWFKNGTPLTDGGNTSGSGGATLVISNVLRADEGGYSVVVTNASGVFTSSVATLTVVEPVIFRQPCGVYSSIGSNATFTVGAAATALTYQWRKDGVPLAGATSSSLALSNLQASDAATYDVVVNSTYGSVTSAVVTLCLAYCDDFNPGTINPGLSDVINIALPQPDGKILVGGTFTNLGGLSRKNIGRLNADGTVDAAFNPGANASVSAMVVQPDGKILVGGGFTTLGGQTRNRLGRLNSDGTLDSTFNTGTGINGTNVNCMVLQPDGKILIGSAFTSVSGQGRTNIARLNADGSLDATIFTGTPTVMTMALQPDGKIWVGLQTDVPPFTYANSVIACRLNPDGTADTPRLFVPGQTHRVVNCLALQPDGKLLVGGSFINPNGQSRTNLSRLNPDGSVDLGFTPSADYAPVCLVLQADGRILIGGGFWTLAGQSRHCIGRLNPDGSLDPNFDPEASNAIHSLAVQPDGKILVAGEFNVGIGGQSRQKIARLLNTTPTIQSLSLDNSTLTWWRRGSAQEIWRATFEASLDGVSWTVLGVGQRIDGGWQLTNVTVQPGTLIQARGSTTGGNYNGSALDTMSYYGKPWLLLPPLSRTNNAGGTASFTVAAAGSDTLQYQWFKDGAPFSNNPNATGAASPTLVVSNLQPADAGGYSVVVTNVFGAVTSSVASLTMFTPTIASQPVSQTNNAGTSAVFSLTPTNIFGPFTLTWLKNGLPLSNGGNVSGSTTATLTLSNLKLADAGGYSAVVTHDSGSLTSAVASLTVTLLPPQNFVPQSVGNGLTLQFTGTPNYPYALQSTTNLVPPTVWQSVLTNTSAADGTWSWSVTNLLDTPKCFYRVVAW